MKIEPIKLNKIAGYFIWISIITSVVGLVSSTAEAQPLEKRCGGEQCAAVKQRLQSEWSNAEARIKSNPATKAQFERALNRNDTVEVGRILRENGVPEAGAYRLQITNRPGGATRSPPCKVVYHQIRIILSDGQIFEISWQEIIC